LAWAHSVDFWGLSAGCVTLGGVELTTADIAGIPRGNVRVPLADFVALWRTSERHQEIHPGDWYSAGVVMVCRWLARATVRPSTGRWYLADAPATGRTVLAVEELIEAEYLAVVKLAMRQPRPAWLADRPGWIEAVEATLHWAWHGYGPATDADRRPGGQLRSDCRRSWCGPVQYASGSVGVVVEGAVGDRVFLGVPAGELSGAGFLGGPLGLDSLPLV
jgi:hypothetical protein